MAKARTTKRKGTKRKAAEEELVEEQVEQQPEEIRDERDTTDLATDDDPPVEMELPPEAPTAETDNDRPRPRRWKSRPSPKKGSS